MSETPAVATGPLGMRLLGFARLPEDTAFGGASPTDGGPDTADTAGTDGPAWTGVPGDEPVGYCLVILRHAGRVLLVRVRHRDCWELPGGGLEPGETARQAAARELWEESGQRVGPEALRFAGFARTSLPDRRVLHGAVFEAETDEPGPFTPNDEIADIRWWDPADRPPEGRVQTVDTHLIALVSSRDTTEPRRPEAAPRPHR